MALPEWRVEPGLLAYPVAIAAMEARAAAIREGTAAELVWLVEHPPLYTAGTSAVAADLLDPEPLSGVRRGARREAPIMGRGSALPMSCSILMPAAEIFGVLSPGWKPG